ncbi:MAG: glycosyltransferase family 9 protein [Bacteroidota bacterium]|nr:glycosyltransferase family 9 protein [Bacteroidota bacterium]
MTKKIVMTIKKILIIRFSSIGDIVLTTPVIRCAKQQLIGTEIHFVTKEAFKDTLINNPNIDKLITFKNDITEIYQLLKAENYDVIIDLHKNLRSLRLKQFLKTKSYSFDKLNLKKFLAVNFKLKNSLPNKHIVERYFEAIANIGVKSDGKGLDYFLNEKDKVNCPDLFFKVQPAKFIALVIGGSYFTKQIPLNKLKEICKNSKLPIVLMGGKSDTIIADELLKSFPNLINACGNFTLNQSASIISQAEWVITSDTGLMHIAAAFNKKIISVWGNTIPEFGMGPYLPNAENKILEIKNLSCRPCSKLGYKKCPKGHFKCMNEIDFGIVKELK